MDKLKRFSKRNVSSSGVVVVVQGKKERNSQDIASSDKEARDPGISQEARSQVPPEAENKLSKTGGLVIY